MQYAYKMRERPPGPGAQPREGLAFANADDYIIDGQRYWGIAVYDRPLTDAECEHYGMEQSTVFHDVTGETGDN